MWHSDGRTTFTIETVFLSVGSVQRYGVILKQSLTTFQTSPSAFKTKFCEKIFGFPSSYDTVPSTNTAMVVLPGETFSKRCTKFKFSILGTNSFFCSFSSRLTHTVFVGGIYQNIFTTSNVDTLTDAIDVRKYSERKVCTKLTDKINFLLFVMCMEKLLVFL